VTPEKVHEYRKRAVTWLEYACAGNPGLDTPRHLEVKENRRGKGYSSCGDLAHWMLFRLGVRLPWINRVEHEGWVCGVNVSRLVAHADQYVGNTGQRLEGGDVIVIANDWPRGRDAHVVCIIDTRTDTLLATAESGLPGNGLQNRTLPMKRKIRVVLPLAAVLAEAEAAGLLEG
jgi:hypothetical protein